MHGLSLLFLALPLLAKAVSLPAALVTGEATKLLKAPFSSSLVQVLNIAGIKLLTKSDPSKPSASTGNAKLKVVTSVQCGKDQTFDNVLIDTGSAVLWVGGEDHYIPGPNTEVINSTFSIQYGIGGAQGTAYRDQVVIGEATGSHQFIGAANKTNGLTLVKPIDGILGLGPSGSNSGNIEGYNATPTFVETLVAQRKISQPVFGIYIAPLGADGAPVGDGELTFGGVDDSKIQGEVTWVPQNDPVNFHWEFNVDSFNFGKINLTGPSPSRTDTGVLGFGIPFDSLFAIRDAYNGNISFDGSVLSGFISFNSSIVPSLPSVDVTIGSKVFSLPSSRYIVPRSLYPALNVTDIPGMERTWISSGGPNGFTMGQKWLENFYTAYDMAQHRIGFALNK